jgi:hypothetical protein
MKNLYKFALATLAFGALSCSSDDGGGSQTGSCESDIPWFQTGKFEKFKMTQFGFDAGTMKLSFGECNGDGLESIMEFRDNAGTLTQTIPNTFWQDGQFVVGDANNDGIDFHKIYKKNAQLNDTWTETDEDGAVIVHTVVDMDSLITVPAGSFHCKVYLRTKSDIINTSHIFWNDEEGQIMEDAEFFKIELMENN